VLLVDKIFLGCPKYFLHVPYFRTYLMAEVLYHEIGHHIHRTKKRDHRDKEFVADEWGDKLLQSFMKERYWYIPFVAAPFMPLLAPFVGWLKRKV
jgi:hypothetical protein